MRSVPGGSFRFVWNPQAMAFIKEGNSVTAAYRGDACVDDVELDLYDLESGTVETEESTWADISLPSLSDAAAFASAHGKLIVMCEWGVFLEAGGRGLGDNPVYVTNMIAWMREPAHHVAYESYFDYNALPHGGQTNAKITGGVFPNSLAAFMHHLA